MNPRIHIYLSVLLFAFLSADSQKITKSDKALLANLETHFQALSADTAGGRAMGTSGEKAAGDYVISELSKAGARPKGDRNGWLQTFTIDEGRQIGNDALFTADGHPLSVGREWFPLALSPAGEVTGSPAIALPESGVPWFQDLREWLETGAGNPRFDLAGEIRAKAVSCSKKGATALILYNSSTRYPDKLVFDARDKSQPAAIPVVYITREAKRNYFKDESASVDIHIRISFTERQRTGHNIIGYLDNGAATTVLISTRYDNSSGLAAMIELARMLAASKLKNNNYLFLVFSGSGGAASGGQGWPGSDYYTTHPAVDLRKTNYLIELDGLGAPGDTLNIGGFATSAVWTTIRNSLREKKTFPIRYDSSAARPGDHTHFYRQQIPLLLFSTGTGAGPDVGPDAGPDTGPNDPVDYPGELRIIKFIYAVIEAANSRGKLPFAASK